MKPLVLTSWLLHEFIEDDFADLAVHFFHRFIWGELPSAAELDAYLGPAALGYLLDGLAFGPTPAITGWDEALRTLGKDKLRDRHKASLRSRLSLTDFGWAVIAHREDFSRHNPIDRRWGGTHLTNDRLWRYAPALTKPGEEGA
jgi:hypothetical protein